MPRHLALNSEMAISFMCRLYYGQRLWSKDSGCVFSELCGKAACGTISENGLYTAPAQVPDPPTVFVEATTESKRMFPAKT
jgi:hypothetical protein